MSTPSIPPVILKFGGTSMGNAKNWQQVLKIISRYENPFVVVSATANTTRRLLAAAEAALSDLNKAEDIANGIDDHHRDIIRSFKGDSLQANDSMDKCEHWIEKRIAELKKYLTVINKEQQLNGQIKDAIASLGERISSYLFAQCGNYYGLQTTWVDAKDYICTNSKFGQADPDIDAINKQIPTLIDMMNNGAIPVMGGFYGSDDNHTITTLGFEGSDYTASLMGAALSATSIEIWTDVSGIYTCDPNAVPAARPIGEISFQEATELANYGAKVLHASTTRPAANLNIPILVKNIFQPEHPGTRITSQSVSAGRAKALTYKKASLLSVTSDSGLTAREFQARVFELLGDHQVALDVTSTTKTSIIAITEQADALKELAQPLKSFGQTEIHNEQVLVSLIGCKKAGLPSLIDDLMLTIAPEAIHFVSFNEKSHTLHAVVDEETFIASIQDIHRSIFE